MKSLNYKGSKKKVNQVTTKEAKDSVIITLPKLDKIAINFNVADSNHQYHILDCCFDKEHKYQGVLPIKSKRYRATQKVFLPDKDGVLSDEFILVQFSPHYPKAAFVRLEFNPSKISAAHYAYFEKYMFEWLDINLPQALKTAWVTRLDICIEILDKDIEELLIQCAKKRKTNVHFGANGVIETIYCGSPASNQITMYNKAAEQGKSGHHIRIEARLKNRTLVAKLTEIANPFSMVRIYDLTPQLKLPMSEKVLFDLFKDSCRYRGIKSALGRLPKSASAKYKNLVSYFPASWWQPMALWDENWTKALETAGLLFKQ